MKFNLLGHPEKLTRDVSIRFKNKKENSELALKFDKEYFDHLSRFKNMGIHEMGRNISVGLKYIF